MLSRFLFLSLSVFCIFQKNVAQPKDDFVQRFDVMLSEAIQKGVFSGTAVVSKDGEIIYKKTSGWANVEGKEPITDKTLFNIGSIGKKFTQEIVNQLVKEGLIHFEDPVSKYLSLFPPGSPGEFITIRQLYDHKSGMGDYFGDVHLQQLLQTDFSIQQLVSEIGQTPLLFAPGTKESYSNSGYAVLGAVIEKVTGKPYWENIDNRILKPLGMGHILYSRSQILKNSKRATGVVVDFDGTFKSSDILVNATSAGGFYMTTEDLLKFARAAFTGKLPSGEPAGMYAIAGGTPDFNAVMMGLQNQYIVVITANMGGVADAIADRTEQLAKGEAYEHFSKPMNQVLFQILKDKGISYVEENIDQLTHQAAMAYTDRFLNRFGYNFLKAGQTDMAIELFELNVKLHPDKANLYDSLGEGYLSKGDKEKAIVNYKKALSLDPSLQSSREALKKLGLK